MLDKIRNLGLNLNSANSAAYFSISEKGSQQERRARDNYIKSDALKYLNELEWVIRAINFVSESKLGIAFVASEIEFKTIINFNDRILNEIQFSVSSLIDSIGNQKRLTAALSINTNSDLKTLSKRQKEFEALKSLFVKLSGLDISGELTSEDSNVLTDLLAGDYFEIYADLLFITQCLIIFIDKLTGIKIIAPQNLSEPSVTLKWIKAVPLY